MILLEDLVRRIVISASCLIVNSVGLPMFIGPICKKQTTAAAAKTGLGLLFHSRQSTFIIETWRLSNTKKLLAHTWYTGGGQLTVYKSNQVVWYVQHGTGVGGLEYELHHILRICMHASIHSIRFPLPQTKNYELSKHTTYRYIYRNTESLFMQLKTVKNAKASSNMVRVIHKSNMVPNPPDPPPRTGGTFACEGWGFG